MTFNTAFINYVSQYGIPIHFFNYYNFYSGSYYPRENLLAGQLLVKQVSHYTDYKKRMILAQKFIEAAADNIYRNMRYYVKMWKYICNRWICYERRFQRPLQ